MSDRTKLNFEHDMGHYICRGGCGGVAKEPGTCQEEVCDFWGEPLQPCECTDGSHKVEEESEEDRVEDDE